jgi:hypothetical protein
MFHVSGSTAYIDGIKLNLFYLKSDNDGISMFRALAESGDITRIFDTQYSSATTERYSSDIFWEGTVIAFNDSPADYPILFQNRDSRYYRATSEPKYNLAHELAHAWLQSSYFSDIPFPRADSLGRRFPGVRPAELFATRIENNIRIRDGLDHVRATYNSLEPSRAVDTFEEARRRVYED